MNEVTGEIAIKFCKLCDWAYQAWTTHKILFDANERPEDNIGKSADFTQRLSIITQEYSLQQIAKLHDPAVQGQSRNLTVEYILQFGEWGEQQDEIARICVTLDALSEPLRQARNKALAHSDLDTLLSDAVLGEFPEGADDAYFVALQELVNRVHEKWIEGPFPFDDLAGADVQEFLALLARA